MDKKFILRLLPNGDIDIIYDNGSWSYTIYHKTFNPGEKIKDNLIEAYEKWVKLTGGEND